MKKEIFLLLSFLISVNTALAIDVNEYTNEFNNEGEECYIDDFFEYSIPQPLWFNPSNKKTSMPLIYRCYNGSSSIFVVYDIINNEFLNDKQTKEILSLSNIKSKVLEINLSSYISEKISVCNPYDMEELSQQLLNLGADVTDWYIASKKLKKYKDISNSIRLAKNIDFLSDFNAINAILSAACIFDDFSFNNAINFLTRYNILLLKVRAGSAYQGVLEDLRESYNSSRRRLDAHINSFIAQRRNELDNAFVPLFKTVGNVSVHFWNWITHASDITGFYTFIDSFKISDDEVVTNYEIAEDLLSDLSADEVLISTTDNNMFNLHKERINQKNSTYFNVKINNNEVQAIKQKYPLWTFWMHVQNLFIEPDYNITLLNEGKNLIEDVVKQLTTCEYLYKLNKFNSAIQCNLELKDELIVSNDIIDSELNKTREFRLFN